MICLLEKCENIAKGLILEMWERGRSPDQWGMAFGSSNCESIYISLYEQPSLDST
jgi:hypothetical protein